MKRQVVHLQKKAPDGSELPQSWCGVRGNTHVDHFKNYNPTSSPTGYYACWKCWAYWICEDRYIGFHGVMKCP